MRDWLWHQSKEHASIQEDDDKEFRLRAARGVQQEAQAVCESLSNEYWLLPPAEKVEILRFIMDTLINREDAKELTKQRLDEIDSRIEVDDWTGKSSECAVCGDGGDIMCCDFCSCSYHMACIRPMMTEEPPEDQNWYCQFCTVQDASTASFAPLGPAYDGVRYWFVGGHIFGESSATGRFSPCSKDDISWVMVQLKKSKSTKGLRAALSDKIQHLADSPIPEQLCQHLNGFSEFPVPAGHPKGPTMRNVSSRYLRPMAPAKHSIHWDFTVETGGAWWWHDPDAVTSTCV